MAVTALNGLSSSAHDSELGVVVAGPHSQVVGTSADISSFDEDLPGCGALQRNMGNLCPPLERRRS
jgi:hypothetical protein